MRLEIQSIDIHDVQPGSKTYAKNRVLYVHLKELEEILLKDRRLKSVDIHLVYPGEKVRMVNVMDVVQPRCKIDKVEADFPGFIGRLQLAGEGRTRSLRGVGIVISNPLTNRKYSALLDMSGLAAEISRYAKMRLLHIAPTKSDGIEERDFEDAVKLTGLKTAVYLARGAEGHPVDETEVFELDIPNLNRESKLPRVAYFYQLYSPQHDHIGISDPCFYGTDVRNLTPTIIHPNEVLDGGVVGAHTVRSLDTYTVQNHGVIKELYGRHGKDLTFAGVVCGVASMEPVPRKRQAMMAASLVRNVLGAEGVILTKIHGGLPHVDLALVAEECEKLGVKTAIFTQPLISYGTLADTLLFNAEAVNLIITVGATMERIMIPLDAERFLGGTADTKIYCPDPIVQHAGDAVIDVEQFLIAGVHDHLGGANIAVKEY
ncbi:MAG: glycine/sarcosine/betaine reductase component B subunit [Thermodesulfobacteriota bacterium]